MRAIPAYTWYKQTQPTPGKSSTLAHLSEQPEPAPTLEELDRMQYSTTADPKPRRVMEAKPKLKATEEEE